jgi:hypothetical protein
MNAKIQRRIIFLFIDVNKKKKKESCTWATYNTQEKTSPADIDARYYSSPLYSIVRKRFCDRNGSKKKKRSSLAFFSVLAFFFLLLPFLSR